MLLTVLACFDEEGAPVERFDYADEGALCVRTGVGNELLISVVVDGCGSGCASIVESACEVDAVDGELVVHSSITVAERRGDAVCPTECVTIGVSCASMQAAPGDYVFRHGGDTSRARLPTDVSLLLGGGGASSPEVACR
jgi:hypothetical protein